MKFSEILNADDIQVILGKSLYWDEVKQRDNSTAILNSELLGEVNRLKLKILWILKEGALQAKAEEEVSK